MMKLTRYEQETVILFNEEESQAQVYTYNKPLQKKLDKLCNREGAELKTSDSAGAKTYLVPKTWIKVTPKRQVSLTEVQRKAIGERLLKSKSS